MSGQEPHWRRRCPGCLHVVAGRVERDDPAEAEAYVRDEDGPGLVDRVSPGDDGWPVRLHRCTCVDDAIARRAAAVPPVPGGQREEGDR